MFHLLSFFFFLVLSNSLCPALFLLSLFTLPLPETDRKSKKLQNPPVFFFKKNIEQSSNNLRKIIPNPHFLDQTPFTVVRKAKSCKTLLIFFNKSSKNTEKSSNKSSPTHIFWTNPPSQWSGNQKVAKPSCFFQKITEKSSKNHRKIIPNPHFLDQPPFTVVRKAKSCKTLLFFFKKSSNNHRKIFEKSSKNHPQPTFSGPTPLHSGQESKKLQNPPVFFKKSSKNHRTIFEKSSKNLRKIILTGIHLQKIIQQITLPDINLPKIILPIFTPCSPAWNTI